MTARHTGVDYAQEPFVTESSESLYLDLEECERVNEGGSDASDINYRLCIYLQSYFRLVIRSRREVLPLEELCRRPKPHVIQLCGVVREYCYTAVRVGVSGVHHC
jgi:hypothetical protein